MAILEIIGIIVGIGVVGFLLLAWLGGREGNKAGDQAGRMIVKIEEKYESFIRQHLNLSLIDEGKELPDEELLEEEAMEYLAPDIQGLIAHINATQYSLARTKHESTVLINVPTVVNDLFEKSRNTMDKKLTEPQEHELKHAFRTAIRSHIKKRMLDVQTGKALEDL